MSRLSVHPERSATSSTPSWPEKPWSRVHIDYAGPMEGKMFLLIVDAHSKWLEVHSTNSATSTATIELLRKSFATLGLPEVVVSDNATAFTSLEFTESLKRNGLVERAVQTFKESFKGLQEGSINTRISRFLFKYRLTPYSSTGISPAAFTSSDGNYVLSWTRSDRLWRKKLIRLKTNRGRAMTSSHKPDHSSKISRSM